MNQASDAAGIRPEAREAARAALLALNNRPAQRRLRDEKAWYVAAVFFWPGDYDRGHLVAELKRMREAGFTAVRFHTHHPTELAAGRFDFARPDDWMDAAAEAGIGVIYHLRTQVSEAALAAHGVSRQVYAYGHFDDPQVLAAIEDSVGPVIDRYGKHPALAMWAGAGEPHGGDLGLATEDDRRRFAEWLRARYGTLEALDRAWNLYPETGRPIVSSFETASALADSAERFPGQAEALVQQGPFGKRCYGANRDLMRYLTDKGIARLAAWAGVVRRHDPEHPLHIGAHQLFLNQAAYRWDTPRWARVGDTFGTSIHLSWHFEPVLGEVDRPVYMQARMTHDCLKGGLTSAYETTGGAVQYSGGYPNAMTAGLMRRLLCAYLAAGNQALAFWTWNHRPGGWEVGEYGLTTLSGRLTPWAAEITKAARGLEAHHAELWDAEDDTRVGVLGAWDTDAILLQEPDSHLLQDGPTASSRGTKMQASWARIGLARALMNQRVPFAYVTDDEVLAGGALAYPVLYAPHLRALRTEVVEALGAYVEGGGRLVADVQFAFLSEMGKVRPAGGGGPVERVFGAWIDVHHHTRTEPIAFDGMPIEGLYGTLVATRARVVARFSDGSPAVSEVRHGRGSAVLVAFDAARMCRRPGRDDAEAFVASLVRGDAAPGWSCDAPMAFRRSAPCADHYFVLNDGPARPARLEIGDRSYAKGEDVLDGRPVEPCPVVRLDLPARSALWLRFEKQAPGRATPS